MFMKKTATAMALVLAGGLAASAETTLVFNRYLPDQNEIMRAGVLPWAKAVEEASNGGVVIDFTASSLAPPPVQLDMIRSGIADVAINLSSFTAKQWLAPLIGELPLQFDAASSEAFSVALWRTYDRFFREAEKLDGVHVVALWALTGNHVWNNKRPVEKLADAKGLKIRVNPNGAAVTDAMGAVVVSRPAIESFEIITRGVVDGTVLPITSVQGLRLLEELKYGTLFADGLYRSTVSIIVNDTVWNAMPEADRMAIEKVSGEHLARLAGSNFDAAEAEVRALLEPSGIAVTEMPAAEIETLAEAVAGETDAWAARVKDLGLDPDEVLAYFRQQLADAGN